MKSAARVCPWGGAGTLGSLQSAFARCTSPITRGAARSLARYRCVGISITWMTDCSVMSFLKEFLLLSLGSAGGPQQAPPCWRMKNVLYEFLLSFSLLSQKKSLYLVHKIVASQINAFSLLRCILCCLNWCCIFTCQKSFALTILILLWQINIRSGYDELVW